jgi:hypothetical protein
MNQKDTVTKKCHLQDGCGIMPSYILIDLGKKKGDIT